MANQRYDLILVSLSSEQIEKAREANGRRKRITHALLCGPFGQMFGTEKQCLKYYAAWSQIFPDLFERAYQLNSYSELNEFESTFDLVNILIDRAEKRSRAHPTTVVTPERPRSVGTETGCLGVFLGGIFLFACLLWFASWLP